jgi:hypothetical protein
MGPLDHLAPPIPRWLRMILVLVLAGVEIPIYHEIFRAFHPRSEYLRWAFTIPVAAVMVLAPHIAGVSLRKRDTLPHERVMPWVAALALLAWAGGTAYLGMLRSAVLLATQTDPETGAQLQPLEDLHLGNRSVTAVFCLLLVLSGLIAFLLGLSEQHPGVVAMRAAQRAVRDAENDQLAARAEQGLTLQSRLLADDALLVRLRQQSDQRCAAIEASYRSMATAYLRAVALELRQPAVTQAIGAYLAHLDLPPITGPAPTANVPQPNRPDPQAAMP